jgi:hypothetical protein
MFILSVLVEDFDLSVLSPSSDTTSVVAYMFNSLQNTKGVFCDTINISEFVLFFSPSTYKLKTLTNSFISYMLVLLFILLIILNQAALNRSEKIDDTDI